MQLEILFQSYLLSLAFMINSGQFLSYYSSPYEKSFNCTHFYLCSYEQCVCWMFSVDGLRVLVICALRWCKVSLHLPSSRSAVFTDLWELRTSEYYAFHKVMNVAQFF